MASKTTDTPTDDEKKKIVIADKLAISAGLFMTAVTMVVPTRAPMVLRIKNGDAIATVKTMGLMSTFAAIVELIVNPVLGKLSDEMGRKPFMMLAPLVNAVLHTLVAAMPDFLPMNFLDRMISGSMIFGYVAPAQASMADLYSTTPAVFGQKMAAWGAYFGVGCALGPYIGSRLQGPKSFLASALTFLVAACYMNGIPETLAADAKKKFKLSDINPVAFLKLFKDQRLGKLAVTTGLQSFGDYVNIYDINNLFMIKVLGYDQGKIGNFATTVGLTQIGGGMVTKKIIAQIGLQSSTLFANSLWIIGMAMMGTARNTQQAFTALALWTFGHQRNTSVAPYMQKYGAQLGMGRAEIIAATGNLGAYVKVLIPLFYSNIFAWATSGGRNMPGLPYYTICCLTALSQCSFWAAGVED
jgi:MFS family permease